MGVQCRIVVYTGDEDSAVAAADAGFHEIARLEDLFSDYRSKSELSRLGDHAGLGPVPASDDMMRILTQAREVSEATDGAFDVTCGPAVALWRESRRTGVLPGAEAIARAREALGWHAVEVDPQARTVTLSKSGMRLDLGGIAKGYAAHHAVVLLKSLGVSSCMVALAGDIAVGEAPPGTPGWRVTVQGDRGSPGPTLVLANASVSTSGDAEQFVVIGGLRYSHIIDPRTGVGTPGGVQATVVARDGAIADALPKAVCVTGPGEAVRLATRFQAAFIISDHGMWTTVDPADVLHAGAADTPQKERPPR